MKSALVLFCVSWALAAESPPASGLYQIKDTHTVTKQSSPGKEFVYYYDAQVMTGIPRTSAQRSGTRIQCAVLVYPLAGGKYTVKLESIEIGSIDQRIPFSSQNRILPRDMFDPATMASIDKTQLEEPFQIQRRDGKIVELKCKDKEQPWVKNVKRGILNLLSVDLVGKSSSIKSKYCQAVGSKDCADDVQKEIRQQNGLEFYSQPEVTVEGNCRVDYTVVPSSGDAPNTWNITKVVDLSKCHGQQGSFIRRPQVAYNFHLADSCPGCESQGRSLNATTYMNIDCFGDSRKDCVIERVSSVSVYSIPSLTDEPSNTIRTKVNQSLILIEVRQKAPPNARQLKPQKHGLEYSLEWDRIKEEFQMYGKAGPWKSLKEFSKWGKNKVVVCMKLLKELGADMKAEIRSAPIRMETAGRFAQLVRVMRGMTEAELDTLHEKAFDNSVGGVSQKNAKAIKDILHSAVASAGTLAALKHTKKCIEQNKLRSPIRVTSALKQLQNARIVSKEMTKAMEDLCQSVESNPFYYQVCLLSLGSMIRARCQPAGNVLAIQQIATPPKCSSAERKELVKIFTSKLNTEKQSFARNIALIKGLSNTGLTEMAPFVQKIATDFEYPEEIRTQAVLALRTLKELAPKYISQVCLPITLNRRVEPSVRVACAHVVLASNPEMPELLTLVSQINRRRDSRIVKSFIYSEISGLANSTGSMHNPCTKRVAQRARQVLRLINDNEKVLTSSFSSKPQLFSSKQPYGMELLLESLGSNSSFIPSVLAARMGSSFMGFNVPEVLSLALQSKGLDKVIVNLLRNGVTNYQSRARRASGGNNLRQQLAGMVVNAESHSDDARLVAYLRVMGQEAGALPLTKPILEWLLQQYKQLTNAELKQEFTVHLASIYAERLFKVPTAMGLPIVVRAEVPMVFQAKGSLGQHNTQGHYLKDMNVRPTILAKQEVTVEVWSPVVNSGVKLAQRVRISQPIAASVSKSNKPEVQLAMPQKEEETELITVSAEPLCFRRKWYDASENSYVHAIGQIITSEHHARFSRNRNAKFQAFGIEFEMKYWHSRSHLEGYASFPLVLPTAGPSGLIITASPAHANCRVMKIRMPKKPHSTIVANNLASRVHEISGRSPPFTAKSFFEKELTVEMECPGYYRKAVLTYKASPGSRLRRVEAKVSKSKNDRPSYCAEAEALYPSSPIKTDSAMNGNIKSRIQYNWGPNCEGNDKQVSIESLSDLSKAKRDYILRRSHDYRNCENENSPVECYHILSEAQKPDRHSINITYQGVSRNVREKVQKLLAYFSASHIMNAKIDKYDKSAAGKINVEIRVDPVTHAQQNITLREPGQTIMYKDVKSNLLSAPNAMVMRLFRPSSYVARCLVSDRIIKNFDGLHFRAPVTDCWTVLAKDCSKANRFAVLLRKQAANSNLKVLGVMTPTKMIEISKEAQFTMKVDGAQKPIPSPNDQMKELVSGIYIQQYSSKKIKITLPKEEVSVYFDGKAVSTKISAAYFSEQCGLCGHFNSDEDDSLRSSSFEREQSVLGFFKSYQIVMNGCKEASDANKYHLGDQPVLTAQNGEYKLNRESESPIQARRGAYRSGRYCVSKEKVKTCKIGSTPVDVETKEKSFACLASTHDAHEYARRIADQDEIQSIPTGDDVEFTTKIEVAIPKRCVYH